MGDSAETWNCPRCGSVNDAAVCSSCGQANAPPRLRLLTTPRTSSAEVRRREPADVRLVREYKGPTARQLEEASDDAVALLPGRVLSVDAAVRAGDLEEANRRMDDALGMLISGPGSRPRRSVDRLALALWIAWFAACAAMVWWGLR